MSDESTSNREKRRIAREGARRLQKKEGWDTTAFKARDPKERLRELDQQVRDEAVYGEAGACEACVKARVEADDETALCEQHLAEAMGF